MIRAETWEHARAGRMLRDLPIFQGFRTNFIVSAEEARPAPQAFLVEQNAGVVLQAHFHSQPQFQVVAGGSGLLGSHPIQPFAIHYTSAHSPYGPIAAGREGVSYFTLRVVANEGAFFMPESRAQLRRDLKKTQVTVDAPALSDAHGLRARHAVSIEALISPQADGLAAWLLRVPPQASVPAPVHPNGAGRFYVVAAGAMQLAGAGYPRLSTAWVSPDEEPIQIAAGAEGLELLALQFPADALTGADQR